MGQSNKKFKFIEKIKENKKLQTTIVIILIILVVFVFLTGIFNTEQKQTKKTGTYCAGCTGQGKVCRLLYYLLNKNRNAADICGKYNRGD